MARSHLIERLLEPLPAPEAVAGAVYDERLDVTLHGAGGPLVAAGAPAALGTAATQDIDTRAKADVEAGDRRVRALATRHTGDIDTKLEPEREARRPARPA